MNKAPIKVGVVGYGYWSPKLIRNILTNDGCELAGIAEKQLARHAHISKEHPGIELYQRYQDLFNRPDIDAVIIATIPSSHYRIARTALQAGKHVLVEKPLALSVEDAEILCDLARRKKCTLMVDHTYLYSPAINRMGELIRSGELGVLHTIESTRVNLGLFQRDTNVLWDLAPHDFAILLSLFNERPVSVSAFGTKTVVHPNQSRAQESDAHIVLRYLSGLSAHIHVSWISPEKIRQITVIGSEKIAQYDQLADPQIRVMDQGVLVNEEGSDSGALFAYKVGETTYPEYAKAGEDLGRMITDFITTIHNQEQSRPCSSGEVGLEVVRLLCAAEESMRAQGRAVRVSPSSKIRKLLSWIRPK